MTEEKVSFSWILKRDKVGFISTEQVTKLLGRKQALDYSDQKPLVVGQLRQQLTETQKLQKSGP